MRLSSRVGQRTYGHRPTPQVAWVALGALLIVALAATLVAGSMLLRHDAPPLSRAYEAVFLRPSFSAGEPIVQVVGVSTDGSEREVASLPVDTGYRTVGVLSPSGLLALPSSTGSVSMMRWEIFDLHRANARPLAVPGILQNAEQLAVMPYFRPGMDRHSAVWGPGDQLAISWYFLVPDLNDVTAFAHDPQVSFVQGRTGTATSVPVPDGLIILPHWAADGSGVMVSTGRSSATPVGVLLRNGAVVETRAAPAENSCRTRSASGEDITVTGETVPRSSDTRVAEVDSGVGFACLAPDDSTIVRNFEFGDGGASPSDPKAELILRATGARVPVDGSFAGWLEVDR
jgi:hypothetical protein